MIAFDCQNNQQSHNISMNLIKDFSEWKDNKKDRFNKYLQNLDLQDLRHRVQHPAVRANLQRVKVTETQFITLCHNVKKQALAQPGLLKIDGPIYVCSGTLGNYQELSNIIDRCGYPQFNNYLFLGDYSGRYNQSVECIIALFTYKLFMPNNFFLLRGCHQTLALARSYMLKQQLTEFFQSSRPWIQVCETFCALPYAAIIDQKIFCVHGGISPYLQSLDQINRIPRPLDASDKELSCDLLWADPSNLYEGWTENERGLGVCFGSDLVNSFLRTHDLTLICRAHQIAYQGFKFFAEKKLVTICSLSQFCGLANNSSAVMIVDEQSNVLFKLISERNNYSGGEQEEGLTFVDIVQRKKQREEKRLIEQNEADMKGQNARGTRERKNRGAKQ